MEAVNKEGAYSGESRLGNVVSVMQLVCALRQ